MGKDLMGAGLRKKRRIGAAFLLLAAAVTAGILLNICIGSVSVSLPEILKSLSGQPIGEKQQRIIQQIRLPRTVIAAVLGGALALSGYLLQTFFHNIKVPKHPTKHTTWHNYQNIYYGRCVSTFSK